MTHPYRGAGRSGAKLKFSKMLGTTKGAKHMNDDSVVSPNPAQVKSGVDDVKIMGKPVVKRLDRARGGKVGKTVVNINVESQKPPMPPILPPMPPPGGGPMAGPAMPPKPPMMPSPGMGAGPMGPGPGAGLPMPRKRGGRVYKDGGGGVGEVGKAKLQGRINAMDPLHGIMPKHAISPDWVPEQNPLEPEEKKNRGGYISGTAKGNQIKQWAQYSRKNSYHKKNGGGLAGKAVLTGGADSGPGRLQHSKQQGKARKPKGN